VYCQTHTDWNYCLLCTL